MKVFTSREAQNHFGDVMMEAIREPVAISRYGKEALVVMSQKEYMKFSQLEDMYLVKQADEAMAEGTIGHEETKKLMDRILRSEHED
jgi:antitoxin Phd